MNLKNRTVLIVEDDEALLLVMRDNFEAQQASVLTATTGPIGLELALKNSPDLIILDIMLPGINGYEVCMRIREEGGEMPIIMATAKDEEDDVVRGLHLGADDYVTKPFSIRELMARAKAFIRRADSTEESTMAFGNFRLDTVSHRLLHEGQEIELMPKEYHVLEYFLRNKGKALTRNKLLEAVWGSSLIVTDRSVDRCIATLRRKLKNADPTQNMIRTIRDVGYRFEPTY
ncbi:DNA-binding response regulator [bacterium M21]|nr:DNA-binding response regulator [bacterium M21]